MISLGKAAVAPVLAVLSCFLPASAVAAVDDNEAVALITKFYQNFFHEKSDYASEDATIDALCSDNLKKKLRDAYEYDYEGSVAPYATWLFTTGAQDGPGDSKFVGAAAVGGGDGVIGSLADHGLGGFRHSIFLLAALRLQPGRRVYFAPAPRPAAYRRAALLDTYYYNMNKSRSFAKIWRTAL